MPGVADPKAGEDLAHNTEVLFHLALFDADLFFDKLAGLHAMCRKLEKKDGIVYLRKVGLKPNACKKYSSHLAQ